MNKQIILLFIVLFFNSFDSHAYDVTFGESEKAGKRNAVRILGKVDNYIYVFKTKFSGISSQTHTIHKYDPTSLQSIKSMEVDIKYKDFKGIKIFSDKIVIFLNETDKKANTQRLYYNIYDLESLTLKKANQELAKFELLKGKLFKRAGNFRILESRDKSKLGIFYDLPYDKGSAEKFGCSVFDQDFEKLREHNFVLPVNDELIDLGEAYVSNSGRFYLTALQVKEKKIFKAPEAVFRHIYEVNEEGSLEDYDISLEGKYIFEYTFDVNDDNDIICTGFYGQKTKTGVAGAFYIKIDGEDKEIVEEKFQEFPDSFITEGWSDRAKKKADKKKKKGKGSPTLYNYDIRDIISMEDGSTIITAEQFYIVVRTYTDSKGNTRTIYYYYYNDLVVYKMNASGEFDWYSKVPKYQVSTNDGGYYSSYSFHYDKENLYFMFNDNVKNYEDGNVVGGKTYPTSFSSNKKNVTSLVEMSIETGELKKMKLFTKAELKTIAVPKVNFSDVPNNILYIFGKKGKNERLGRIKF